MTGWRFHRGLVAQVTIEALAVLEHGEQLLRLAPVRYVWLRDVDDLIEEVARCSALARLSALDLNSQRIGEGGLQALARSPHLDRLTRLELNDTGVGDEGVRSLAASATAPASEYGVVPKMEDFQRLECLFLDGNPITPEARAALRARFGAALSVEEDEP